MRVLILHGWGGSDYPHWQAILSAKIACSYGTVSFPLIQHPHFPHLNRWKREILNHIESFKPNIVVCHSLANSVWFHLLLDNKAPYLDKLYIVAPPSMNTKHDMLSSFFPIKVPKSLNAKEAIVVVSDNDPWIDLTEADYLAKSWGVPLKILKEAGHINIESGYGQWNWIENEILKGEKCHCC